MNRYLKLHSSTKKKDKISRLLLLLVVAPNSNFFNYSVNKRVKENEKNKKNAGGVFNMHHLKFKKSFICE